jgi:hypothetical protein
MGLLGLTFAALEAEPNWHVSIGRFQDCTGYDAMIVKPDGAVEFPEDLKGFDAPFPYTRETAFKGLLNTCEFLDHAVGPDGVPSLQVELLNVLWHQPDQYRAFEDLSERANMPGKLYALVGLYDANPKRFAHLARQLKKGGGTVVANSGCWFRSVAVDTIIVHIQDGSLPASFRKIGTYMKWLSNVSRSNSPSNNRLKLAARGRSVAD